MYFLNCYRHKQIVDFEVGDRVEIILRSSLYCVEQEQPVHHSGVVTKLENQDDQLVAMWVQYDKDSLYDGTEEEYLAFEETEKVFKKKFDIAGYAKAHEYMTLSVKGENGKIINFTYFNGSMYPESIQEGSSLRKRPIVEEDKPFIHEILRYGQADYFFHFLMTGDELKAPEYKVVAYDSKGNEIQFEDCSIDNLGQEVTYTTKEKAEQAKEQLKISLPHSYTFKVIPIEK
jgi:hypothetical protein